MKIDFKKKIRRIIFHFYLPFLQITEQQLGSVEVRHFFNCEIGNPSGVFHDQIN